MTGRDEVERLVAVITMDCYNLAEQVTAFYEAFAEEVPLPTTATVIGTTVELVGIDIADHGEVLTARCHRARGCRAGPAPFGPVVCSRYRSWMD